MHGSLPIGFVGTAASTRMAKKQSNSTSSVESSKQINFRADGELYSRVEWVSKVLGLDLSNLVRMILKEKLPEYEQRAQEVEEDTVRRREAKK